MRVHPTGGDRPSAWNEFRAWGSTKSRFDHHTLPRRLQRSRRILYAARGVDAVTAALGEYFQDDGGGVSPFDLGRRRTAVAVFDLGASVTLVDLDSGWITRAGGNQAIRTGPRARARDWARAIYRAYPDVHGLAYGSSVWGPGKCVALWERAGAAMPPAPVAIRTLDDPALRDVVAAAAEQLGTYVV